MSEALGDAWLPYHSEQVVPDGTGSGSQESVKPSSDKIPLLFGVFLLRLLSTPTCFMNLTGHKIS